MKDTTRALKEELNNSFKKYQDALNSEIEELISESRKQLECLKETGVLKEYHMFLKGEQVDEDEYWVEVPISAVESTLENLKKAKTTFFSADARLTLIPTLTDLEDLTLERLTTF